MITPATRTIRHLETLRDRGTLVVLLDRRSNQGELCSVSVDHARGGELAAGYLFGLGHRPDRLHKRTAAPVPVRGASPRYAPGGPKRGLSPDETIVEYTIDPITAFGQAELTVDKLLRPPGSARRQLSA